jgi:hypothetical protein
MSLLLSVPTVRTLHHVRPAVKPCHLLLLRTRINHAETHLVPTRHFVSHLQGIMVTKEQCM